MSQPKWFVKTQTTARPRLVSSPTYIGAMSDIGFEMQPLNYQMRKKIISFIDWFYPPFKKVMPLQTFRYAVCGGSNTVLDIFLFYISFNFILHQQILHLGFISLKAYNAALGMAFCITFPLGFLMNKFIVFNASHLRSHVQLFRYVLIVAANLFLNYAFLNVMVQYMNFYPTVAKIFATVIIVAFSYLSQKHFTFRTANTVLGPIDEEMPLN